MNIKLFFVFTSIFVTFFLSSSIKESVWIASVWVASIYFFSLVYFDTAGVKEFVSSKFSPSVAHRPQLKHPISSTHATFPELKKTQINKIK